jgi:hypothetical protein
VITAFIGPETERKTLIEFYKKIRPFGPGWNVIRAEAGISKIEANGSHENIPLGLLGWVTGCTAIWSALFMVGNFLYGRLNYALMLLAVFLVSGTVLITIINKLWNHSD